MEQIKTLFSKYLNDACTVAEIKQLMAHFTALKNEEELKKVIAAEMAKEPALQVNAAKLDKHLLKIYAQVKTRIQPIRKTISIFKPVHKRLAYTGIAAALVLAFLTIYFVARKIDSNGLLAKNDAAPGGNKATLILADGSKIALTDAMNGKLLSENGLTITKTKDGQLIYQSTQATSSGINQYNTIRTPAGGKYQVVLPDGSHIWLNALSSLKYPVRFNGNDRKVFLTGEAYFEVAKDAKRPFIVATNGAGKAQEVKVLGTHFNINSYQDEETTKTTLLEGSVKVSDGLTSKVLKPGQQAAVSDRITVKKVNVDQAIDWKNDSFYYNDENIYQIMRKLARWYNVSVSYQGDLSDLTFGGEISRTKKLSEVLYVLERTGKVHFELKEKEVIVKP